MKYNSNNTLVIRIMEHDAAIRIQAHIRGYRDRSRVIPAAQQDYWVNAQTIKILQSRIRELEETCVEQQRTLDIQGEKIKVLDRIFNARQEREWQQHPLPVIGYPEE